MGERGLARPHPDAAADHRRHRGRMMRARGTGAARSAGRSSSSPAIEAIIDTSRSSAGDSGGRIDGSRLASIDLPAPGGPTISRLWPPAAATSSARLAVSWPLMSARSGSAAAGRRARLGARQDLRAAEMIGEGDQAARREDRHVAARPGRLGPHAAGQIRPRPMALAAIAAGSTPATARSCRRATVRRARRNRRAVAGQGADRRHQRERDRQIVVAALLRQVGRGEVDDDPLRRQRQAGRVERRRIPGRGFPPPPCRAGRRSRNRCCPARSAPARRPAPPRPPGTRPW